MNISATNGYYRSPGSSLTTTGVSSRLKADKAAEQAIQSFAPAGEKGPLEKNRAASLNLLQGEVVRGRLADNPAQNAVARRALAEYIGTEQQERREELKVLGVDVYA